MIEVVESDGQNHLEDIRMLLALYGQYAVQTVNVALGTQYEADRLLHHMMATLDQFRRPSGRLFLAKSGEAVVGICCLKRLDAATCELKRLFVHPDYRHQGAGWLLVKAVVTAGRQMGFARIRLDTAPAFASAQRLYQAAGFYPIGPYDGTEADVELWDQWRFFELRLT